MTEQNEKQSVFAKREEEVLAMWERERVFEKSVERPAGKHDPEEFVFYDGPPFATGLPHYGHLLQSAVKDAIPRYKTMRGFRVRRQWGWDCHGLPIENIATMHLSRQEKIKLQATISMLVARFNEFSE